MWAAPQGEIIIMNELPTRREMQRRPQKNSKGMTKSQKAKRPFLNVTFLRSGALAEYADAVESRYSVMCV